MLTVVPPDAARVELSALDEICRQGARRMLAAALEAEADAYVAQFAGEVDETGHRLVTRNGHAVPRVVTTTAGAIEVTAPRVDDRRTDPESGERMGFRSSILPPWCRKSPQVTELLPLLYLHGLSTGDFVPALEGFFGSGAGLSASVIDRLSTTWQADHREFMARDLSRSDYVYVWADGIHTKVRLEEDRLCCLVIVGVLPDGTKELVALQDGYRESKESWGAVLRDLRHRGMRAPVLAVGDGALGFWGALRDVFAETRCQRDWFHKSANILDALPKSMHPLAKKMLAEVREGEDREHALDAAKAFDAEFRPRWPKAADKLSGDLDELLAFYDFPGEHWQHLKTSNPIESTFATVRLRTRVTKGPGSRAAGLAMSFKLVESAQRRWHKITAGHLVALVRAGVVFKKGVQVDQPSQREVAA